MGRLQMGVAFMLVHGQDITLQAITAFMLATRQGCQRPVLATLRSGERPGIPPPEMDATHLLALKPDVTPAVDIAM